MVQLRSDVSVFQNKTLGKDEKNSLLLSDFIGLQKVFNDIVKVKLCL